MKQSLNFANILPSICNIYFWIAIFQLHYGNLPNVVWESTRRSTRKTLSGITKADLLKKLGPHLCFISKKASKDAVTLQFLTLHHSSYPYLSRLDYNRSRQNQTFDFAYAFMLTHKCGVIIFYQFGFALYFRFSCYGPTNI